MPTDSGPAVILRQLEAMLVFLDRPVFQHQLVALIVSVLLGALGSKWLHSATRSIVLRRLRGETAAEQESAVQRWLPVIGQLYFPVFSLFLIGAAIRILDSRGQPSGLLYQATILLSIVAAYRVVLALLYILFPQALARRYIGWALNPLFLLFIARRIIAYFVDIKLLGSVPVVTVFDTAITLESIVNALVVFYLFVVASWVVNDSIRLLTDRRIPATAGVINAVQTIARYTIIAVGVLTGLGLLGLNLTTLAVIGGGLSIGIGFGLQHVVGSFISGIWLLFEQTLRPGDIVEVDGKRGIVEKLSIRATTVRGFDNVELVIPNQQFWDSPITTFTGTSQIVRISILVGVSYDSDPQEVRRIMLEVGAAHDLVMREPAPAVYFADFGDSSLNFRLDVWIDSPGSMLTVRSDLNFMIFERFAEHGIHIPFPQRDINLGQGWDRLLKNSGPQENG